MSGVKVNNIQPYKLRYDEHSQKNCGYFWTVFHTKCLIKFLVEDKIKIPMTIEIKKLKVRFAGKRYSSIKPHTPRQKLTIAKAMIMV